MIPGIEGSRWQFKKGRACHVFEVLSGPDIFGHYVLVRLNNDYERFRKIYRFRMNKKNWSLLQRLYYD